MCGNKRIAVLVSGGGTNLGAMLDWMEQGRIAHGVVSVVISSKPDAFALTRAIHHGIPALVVDRKAYSDRASYTRAILEALEGYQPDLIVLAGFLCILDRQFTQRYENRVINVHPSLIPSFCGQGFYGLKVHEAALDRGVKISGATVHFVNEQTDGGPIILQKAVEVLDDDTPERLQKRIMVEAEQEILPLAVALFCEGRIRVDHGKVSIIHHAKEEN